MSGPRFISSAFALMAHAIVIVIAVNMQAIVVFFILCPFPAVAGFVKGLFYRLLNMLSARELRPPVDEGALVLVFAGAAVAAGCGAGAGVVAGATDGAVIFLTMFIVFALLFTVERLE